MEALVLLFFCPCDVYHSTYVRVTCLFFLYILLCFDYLGWAREGDKGIYIHIYIYIATKVFNKGSVCGWLYEPKWSVKTKTKQENWMEYCFFHLFILFSPLTVFSVLRKWKCGSTFSQWKSTSYDEAFEIPLRKSCGLKLQWKRQCETKLTKFSRDPWALKKSYAYAKALLNPFFLVLNVKRKFLPTDGYEVQCLSRPIVIFFF